MPDPELVMESGFQTEPGARAAGRLLDLPDPPTAIFAFNDNMAIGALRAATARGLCIPRDLSIVGFDSTAFCNEVRPQLTSISQPLSLMGRKAIELLVSSIENDRIEPLEIIYPCSLDIRGSTSTIHR
jgi:DNA-binding LacI/PurR family transcriptional regulator